MRLNNDTGTISAIPYAILTLILFGLFLIGIGPILDEFIGVHLDMVQIPAFPFSEQRGETMDLLQMCWGALAFVGVFCVVIFLLMNGAQRGSGGI
jgi:hypothetical protein